MDKWILISICNRELGTVKMFDTAEEAQVAMRTDFIYAVGIDEEELDQICATNGSFGCEDWQLGDFDAWISDLDSIEWHISPITV